MLSPKLLLILLYASTISGAPATPAVGRPIIIERVRRSNFERNGTAALQSAYLKYGVAVPETSGHTSGPHNLAARGGSGITTATPLDGDSEFLAPINVGGQTLMMDIDTGSADFWVFNTGMPSSVSAGHTLYDPSKSSTFKLLDGYTFSLSYGDKSRASGSVGTDTVKVGGAAVGAQAIELANTVTSAFQHNGQSSGILGLASSSMNTIKPKAQKTFYDNVMSSLAQPVFTANLKHATAGSYTFGQIDKSQFQGSIAYTPIDPNSGYWQFSSSSFAVGDGPVMTNPHATPAIADTGTTLMLVSEDVMNIYYSKVEGAQSTSRGAVFPCDSKLPDFHIQLAGNSLSTIPGPLINYSHDVPSTQAMGLDSKLFLLPQFVLR